MKERPILFSGEMVKAILDGRKTQTRRVIKGRFNIVTFPDGNKLPVKIDDNDKMAEDYIKCPYGQIGDRLWVRETFKYQNFSEGYDNGIQQGGDHDFAFGFAQIEYRDGVRKIEIELDEEDLNIRKPVIDKWYPSIHMPRWASRINLEITNIRIERLQDITEEDSQAEGVEYYGEIDYTIGNTYKIIFRRLWDSINLKRGFGWNVNPFVWVVEFRRI
jgi:hypothetical protein